MSVENLPLAPAQSQGFTRPSGDIVTLLDLTPRDYQDNEFTPLSSDKTWWLPEQSRRLRPFSTCVQQYPFRGPTGFGQRFTFDLKSTTCGDVLFNTVLQIDLSHWFNDTDLLRMESGRYRADTASFTGSISGNILTVSDIISGTLYLGSRIVGNGVLSNTIITSLGSDPTSSVLTTVNEVTTAAATIGYPIIVYYGTFVTVCNSDTEVNNKLRKDSSGNLINPVVISKYTEFVTGIGGIGRYIINNTQTVESRNLSVGDQWFYANSLGTVILERAELEVGDQTIEIVDGDFLNVSSLLFQDLNSQFGLATDGLGRQPLSSLLHSPLSKPFPTTSRSLFIPLPFFFSRVKLQEAFPVLACKEGSIRIHVQLRPFKECVRIITGRRASCDDNPLGKLFSVIDTSISYRTKILAYDNIPQFKNIQLITYSAHTDGSIRNKILRNPFEILTRNVTTFHFAEPLKYAVNKTTADTIQVLLPLELNHPVEEIIWFVRRKSVENNNEWTNYSAVTSYEYDPIFNPTKPLLQSATIQFNGVDIVKAEEQWFRQHIALRHKGGIAAYENFIYGYSFSSTPGRHQPAGTANASRLQSIRLGLNIVPPGGALEQDWEVKVFVLAIQWLRFQDGLTNKMYTD